VPNPQLLENCKDHMPSDIIKFKDENLMVFDQVQKERFKDFTIHLLPIMSDSYYIKKN
jgi:hypothetical protein